ncbi:MAG: RluA family pseudouridine synthase [Ruminococcus flavefaciens]|nr:RluA family pseudouridine synthase [Ruminococcus flavefaciens]MCM1228779.1 RluA family pseudouridine synthase [Ruminococcus flavefaciens]
MSELVFIVDSEEPVTVQEYLREKCGVSRRLLQKLKNRDGGLTCNGRFIRTVDNVVMGDIITLNSDEKNEIEPNGNLRAEIVFEDEGIVIFNKPSGMPVHPSVRHRDDTLGNLFAYLYPELTFRPVNRLDKDTSGLCIVAKNPHSANILQGRCSKTYYAVVHGEINGEGTVNAPIARAQESIILRCVRDDGQQAVTHYRSIKSGGKYTLLEINLETGRTHQIRVHFAHIGHALAGDDLYGGLRDDISRQALHCGKIAFSPHGTDERITVCAELPQDITDLLKGELL